MLNNTELKVNENSNEWINWIEESITKKQISYYDYKNFNNIQEISSGSSGKVYRTNQKNSHHYLALKSFYNFNIMAKEIVNELKLQHEVGFNNNIIKFYGITTEIQCGNSKKYFLVIEYADNGTLRNYLSSRFEYLTWNDKLNLALQLSNVISYLHDKEIVHRDLHSDSILVHKNTIKLAGLGLSKRIEEESFNIKSRMITYIDPQIFNKKRDSNDRIQIFSLNKNSDVYSLGILLWEISSGYLPFRNKPYNVDLALEILNGLREKPIPNTPENYIKLYTDCWNNEPDNRLCINQVVTKLNAIISDFQKDEHNVDIQLSSEQLLKPNNEISENIINSSLNENISQIVENFSKINIKEIEPSISSNLMNDFELVVNEIIILLEDTEIIMKKYKIVSYLNNHNISPREIYNWLLINQDQENSNSLLLLGVFNHFGIQINVNKQKAFELYQKAANLRNVSGINNLGFCYRDGIGTNINELKAFELFQKAANLGSAYGIYNLGNCYYRGLGIGSDKQKAFELYQKSANLGNTLGMTNLGNCYYCGFGISSDKQKAFELYQKAANLGNYLAQNNLASVYGNGKGVKKDVNQAIYWYKKSAEQGYQKALNNLNKLVTKLKN
ncbi:hypothetical protein RclHR1_06410002 [Rhizophagus clarus]|uniref:Kinase-like domain-containing protein n=1 Tax=Rhizophagus clarus TaxID=94130 RepID=A0A2Z6S4I4_9GLOM|nr:hypothetical protein RclHR1_06410002 [Rhizophagus clarus]GES87965.1 kinase-like domain-containing protein [Rhizophagus clarus]